MKPEEIRTLREHLHLTQEMFARILGVSFATVNRWENGKSAPSGDYARVLQTLQQLTDTHAPAPSIDWQRVGALSAMAAVAGFSPLLTLGAAVAPVLIAHLPSWADVPLGAELSRHRPLLARLTSPIGTAQQTPPSGSRRIPHAKRRSLPHVRPRSRGPTR
jgi:DNA-binding XRE family transcriptional regulator